MAIVGDAYIVVRAVTTGFQAEVNRALRQVNTAQAGQNAGQQFSRGFTKQMSGSSKTFSKFKQESLAANEAFRKLVTTGYFVGPAINGAVGAIAQLVAGLSALVFQVGAALPALIAIPGVLAAIGQAAITAKLAFGGVGKAISALTKSSTGGSKKSEDAIKRIRDAEKRLARTIEDNEETLERSKRNLIDAENALTEARNEAAESLQQLNFDAEDAAIAEKKAAIELEKARETLARVQDLAPNTRARREAELAFAEADLNLRRARDANSDLTKETEKQNAAGVEGSQKVLDASRARDDAAVQLKRDERDATRAVEDAEEAIDEAKKAAKEAAGGVNAVAQAMKDLSPEAQEFARYMAGLKPVLLDLKAAAGKELFGPLQGAMQNLVTDLVPVLKPALQEMGGAIGGVALSFSEMLTTGDMTSRLERVFGRNKDVVKSLGKAAENLTEMFIILLDAAGPLITEFSKWLETITGSWKETAKAKDATGELSDKFSYASEVAQTLSDIFGNIFGALKNIAKAATGPGSAGEALLNSFRDATQKFQDFTGELEQSGALKDYFLKAVPGIEATGRLIVEIFKQIFKIGKNEGTVKFIESLRVAVQNIGGAIDKMGGGLPSFGKFLEKFTEFLALFAESGSIKTFFDVINNGLGILIGIFSNDAVSRIVTGAAALLGAVKALQLMKNMAFTTTQVVAGYGFKIGDMLLNVGKGPAAFGKLKDAFKTAGVASQLSGGGIQGYKTGIASLLTTASGGQGPMAAFATSLLAVSTPALIVAAAIAAVVAIFVIAYTQSEKLREAVAQLVAVIKDKLVQAWEKINDAIKEAMPGIEGVGGVFEKIGDFLADYFIPILEIGLMAAIEIVTDRIVGFIKIVGGIIDIFKAVWEFIKGFFFLFTGDIDKAKEHFGKAFAAMISGLKKVFGGVFDIVMSPFKAAFNAIARGWNKTVAGLKFTAPSWVPFIGGKTFAMPTLQLWGESDAGLGAGTTSAGGGGIRYMAKGGTVFPQAGGTLVRVAEAGRAERIEPLNDAGLSKRDIAMIKMMSGGTAGGQTFNIYPAPKMDETELAAIVSRQLAFQLRAGSI